MFTVKEKIKNLYSCIRMNDYVFLNVAFETFQRSIQHMKDKRYNNISFTIHTDIVKSYESRFDYLNILDKYDTFVFNINDSSNAFDILNTLYIEQIKEKIIYIHIDINSSTYNNNIDILLFRYLILLNLIMYDEEIKKGKLCTYEHVSNELNTYSVFPETFHLDYDYIFNVHKYNLYSILVYSFMHFQNNKIIKYFDRYRYGCCQFIHKNCIKIEIILSDDFIVNFIYGKSLLPIPDFNVCIHHHIKLTKHFPEYCDFINNLKYYPQIFVLRLFRQYRILISENDIKYINREDNSDYIVITNNNIIHYNNNQSKEITYSDFRELINI